MKRLTSRNVVVIALALLSSLLFVVAGCSKSPLSSDTSSSQPTLLHRTSTSVALSPGAELYTDAVIPAATGGQIQLLDVTLDIPAGALKNDTLYSITIPDINTFYNQFGTDGLVFDKPVTVTMSYRDADLSGINVSSIRIAWLNPNTGQFESMQCTVDQVNKTVTGQLNHFSAYALISD